MNISELARKINARFYPCAAQRCPEARHVHASNTMSSLIASATRDTLLVTSLNNSQLIRVAELMDAPGLCLAGGVQPGPELLARARETNAVIMVSPFDLEETRRLLEECLAAETAAQAAARGHGPEAATP